MPERLTANQLVAYNLTRIRKAQGLSQEQARGLLRPYLGSDWSKAAYSAAERSYNGKRVRQFTADDLVALSLAFSVPVAYFFLPPRQEDRVIGPATDAVELSGARSGSVDVNWRDLFEVMLGGKYRASLYHRMLELPAADRPAVNSDTAVAVHRVALNPPEGPLGWMSGDAELPDEGEPE